MTPEIFSAIRSVLLVLGGAAVGRGWVDPTGLETIVGGAVAVITAAWGVWAKRPSSPEAQIIAAKVGR